MLSCTDISFVISFFNFEKFGVKPGFPFMQLNQATYSKLEKKSNFYMFYKTYCWAVICYSICMTNVSYERGIIVLSFPDISFVILLFIFQRFEIKSGFPFFLTHTHRVNLMHTAPHCDIPFTCTIQSTQPNAVVTPLRKAASHEQRKTNLGNQIFWRCIITECHVLRSTNEGILVTVT